MQQCGSQLAGGTAVLPNGSVHDVLSLGAPRAPNEEFRVVTFEGLGLLNMPPCHELTRLLHAVCDMFDVPYAAIALYTDGRYEAMSKGFGVMREEGA